MPKYDQHFMQSRLEVESDGVGPTDQTVRPDPIKAQLLIF